jgi:hypothetical protein
MSRGVPLVLDFVGCAVSQHRMQAHVIAAQPVATPACWRDRRCSSKASAGVRQERVLWGSVVEGVGDGLNLLGASSREVGSFGVVNRHGFAAALMRGRISVAGVGAGLDELDHAATRLGQSRRHRAQ